ncbi:MAG: phage major capsid protein, partial [Lachnospiraceae bacterium]|nr:phage major capsid protein [Lachnospiraceae bacterium]
YDNITIEKGMYNPNGYGLTKTLEKLDPSENYKNTPLEGLDAFQRQLKRFDIKVSGAGSDCVEKFFQTSSSSALFPEYISRAVKQGMEQADVLKDIIATTTHIEGMDYRSIASVPTESEKELKVVTEGTAIPETSVRTQENLVKLKKRGRMLVSSYEALRFQRLDLFTVTLKQIGAYIARSQLKDAVNVIISGDGNSNAAPTVAAGGSSLAYSDIVKLWAELNPYELNTILAPTAMVTSMMNMAQMQDAVAGNSFHATGKMITPLGANLIHVPSMASGKLIGLDKNCALEMVIAGDVTTEYDKLIDKQLERAAITCIAGFAKVFNDSAKVLTVG